MYNFIDIFQKFLEKNFSILILVLLSFNLLVSKSYCEWNSVEVILVTGSLITGSIIFYMGYLARDAKFQQENAVQQEKIKKALDESEKSSLNQSQTQVYNPSVNQSSAENINVADACSTVKKSENVSFDSLELTPIQQWLLDHPSLMDFFSSNYSDLLGIIFFVGFFTLIFHRTPLLPGVAPSSGFGSPIDIPSSPKGFGSPIDQPSSPKASSERPER